MMWTRRYIFLFAFITILLFLCLTVTESLARKQMNLVARTQLRPVNWPAGQKIWFAAGPYWIDEFDQGVQSGTLDEVRGMKIWNSSRVVEFGKGFIRFERGGGVKEGTLARDTQLCVVNTASRSKMSLSFRGGARVEFGYDGCVMKGTLAQDATLKTWDNKTGRYPKGTVLDFNGAGLVTRAILPAGTATGVDGIYQGTCTITGIGAFTFRVTARKGSFEGLVEQKRFHLRFKGNYDAKGVVKNGLLSGWVEDWDPKQRKNVRWTVRGPIAGTLSPAGSRGTVRATTSDGKITRTGTWTANRVAP